MLGEDTTTAGAVQRSLTASLSVWRDGLGTGNRLLHSLSCRWRWVPPHTAQNAQPLLGRPIDLILILICFLEVGICCSLSGAPNMIPRLASDTNALCLAQGSGLVFVAVYKRDRQRCTSPTSLITRAFDHAFKRALRECELQADQLKRPLETKPSVAPSNKVR